jgi:UPF0716 protein FxsA
MRLVLIALMGGIPILDIASLIEVGDRIGVWPTLGMVVAAFFAGSILMRSQGFAILAQAQATLQDGRFPAREVFDGACVLLGSMLLMFPGFVSDVIGVALLIPPLRALLRRLIGLQVRRSGRFAVWTVGAEGQPARGADGRPSPGSGPVIEGDYQSVDEERDRSEPRRQAGSPDAPGSPWTRHPSTPVVPPRDP